VERDRYDGSRVGDPGHTNEDEARPPSTAVRPRDGGPRRGVRCTVQAASRSTKRHGGVDVAKTVEQAREWAESLDPLRRRPRRRPAQRGRSEKERPAPPSPPRRLLEQIREDGVGRDLRVEVMEKSGLRGNEVRDFNLLMEPVRRAAAHMSREGLEGRLRLRTRHGALEETDTHADACTVSVLLLMNAALLHARLESAKGRAADLARVGLLHDAGDRQRAGRGAGRGVDGRTPTRLRAGVPAGAQRAGGPGGGGCAGRCQSGRVGGRRMGEGERRDLTCRWAWSTPASCSAACSGTRRPSSRCKALGARRVLLVRHTSPRAA